MKQTHIFTKEELEQYRFICTAQGMVWGFLIGVMSSGILILAFI